MLVGRKKVEFVFPRSQRSHQLFASLLASNLSATTPINMSSSSNQTFKSFAVAGGVGGGSPFSASLGNAIVKALLSRGLDVKVLARGESVSASD
jgi:hypothetical protein